MGVKHLERIQVYLKRRRKLVTETDIRNALQINRNTVKECLAYLVHSKKVKLMDGKYGKTEGAEQKHLEPDLYE